MHASLKLTYALALLVRPDRTVWTHHALSQALRDQAHLTVTPDQLTAIRAGHLDIPPRLASGLGLVLGLPAEYWTTHDPNRAADLLHTAAYTQAGHPPVGRPPAITDLAQRLADTTESGLANDH